MAARLRTLTGGKSRPPRRGEPRLPRRIDDPDAFRLLTKEEQWGQALRDLRTLYRLGDVYEPDDPDRMDHWGAALFTLAVHAWAARRAAARRRQRAGKDGA